MNLLIPSLALALVAIVLLFAMGKILGGHAAAGAQDPGPEPIRPPEAPAPLAPPVSSSPAGLEPGLQRELEGLLAQGKLIQAIKRYREVFGVGLKEAKEAIDRLRDQGPSAQLGAAPQPPASTHVGDAARDPELLEALAAGKKILAIKRYRELTGASLKESKEAVDAM
jgi:ribosomal protein L7/L12